MVNEKIIGRNCKGLRGIKFKVEDLRTQSLQLKGSSG